MGDGAPAGERGRAGDRPIPRWMAERLVPGRRLFVAVPLPPSSAAAVEALVAGVRGAMLDRALRAGAAAEREVRWVRLDGVHLTLRFLGPTLDERLPSIEAAMRDAAAGSRPFRVTLGGAGAFPAAARPRVLWLGVPDGLEALGALARRLGDGLVAAGWDLEDRPFRPHLTLARSDGIPAGAATAAALVEAARGFATEWVADRIVLFESHTGGGPARYEALREAVLAG